MSRLLTLLLLYLRDYGQCPDISQITVQRAIDELVKNGEILKIGGGRYTSYVWNGEK